MYKLKLSLILEIKYPSLSFKSKELFVILTDNYSKACLRFLFNGSLCSFFVA